MSTMHGGDIDQIMDMDVDVNVPYPDNVMTLVDFSILLEHNFVCSSPYPLLPRRHTGRIE